MLQEREMRIGESFTIILESCTFRQISRDVWKVQDSIELCKILILFITSSQIHEISWSSWYNNGCFCCTKTTS